MILLQDVPDGYEYCFAGNGKCPKASSCLRAIAAQLLSESEGPQPQSVRAVNPFYVGMMGCFSCERYYYHCRKGERPISPEEQQRIARVFNAVGIGTKPKFDHYEYAVAW